MKAKHVGPTKIITWPCSTVKCCTGPWKGMASVRRQQEYTAQGRTWDPEVRCLSNKMVSQLFFKKVNYSPGSVGRGRGCWEQRERGRDRERSGVSLGREIGGWSGAARVKGQPEESLRWVAIVRAGTLSVHCGLVCRATIFLPFSPLTQLLSKFCENGV